MSYDLIQTLLIAVVLVLLSMLLARSSNWTLPAQDQKLDRLRADVEHIRAAATAVARDQLGYRKEQSDVVDHILHEIRTVASQVVLLREMRDSLQTQTDRTDALEQDLRSLVCFEDQNQKRAELPGFCPLRKIQCPVEEEPNT